MKLHLQYATRIILIGVKKCNFNIHQNNLKLDYNSEAKKFSEIIFFLYSFPFHCN